MKPPAQTAEIRGDPLRRQQETRSSRRTVETISISDVGIQTSSAVKSLGITIDRQLTFDQRVANVCKSCYFHMRTLRHVRPSLPDGVAKTVACSIISSRPSYCNWLFAGMSASNLHVLCYVVASTTTFCRHSLSYTGQQSSSVLHTKSQLLLSTLSKKKISHPTCVIFCVTMYHLAVCVRPLGIFYC